MSPSETPNETSGIELSIVMPCLNEAETLSVCLEKAQCFLREQRVSGEIIVADNGSTDGSQALAIQGGARLVPVAAKGYGSALMGGIAAARGRFIIMGDADDSYDFYRLTLFLERLRAGDDLVMGNRFKGGIKPGAMPLLNRYLGNPVLSGLGRLFFFGEGRIGDFHCGLRGFQKAAALRMDLRSSGMEFASEMVIKAVLLRMKISEVPTTLSPAGRSRPPHLRPWRDGWRHLRFLLIYSPRWLFYYPGLVLMSLGLGVGLWILPSPRTLGSITYDVHTLLYAAVAIIIGFQGISCAIFTKVFAMNEGLLPEDPRVSRLFRLQLLEKGLILGGLCVALGLAGSAYAVGLWGEGSFGQLDTTQMLRLVIPSVTVLVIGCQLGLASFFLSILWLRRRRTPDNAV